MKRKSTLSLFLILSFLNLLILPMFSGCGDDSDENTVGNIEDVSPDSLIQSLSDAEKKTFCAWYVENAGMSEAITCTIEETETDIPAVTTTECVENLASQPDCAVSAYKACAPIMKADRCGFEISDCPELAACLVPSNASPTCTVSGEDCLFVVPGSGIHCRYKMNVELCVTLSVFSLGLYNLVNGVTCDGKVSQCGIGSSCYVSDDCY